MPRSSLKRVCYLSWGGVKSNKSTRLDSISIPALAVSQSEMSKRVYSTCVYLELLESSMRIAGFSIGTFLTPHQSPLMNSLIMRDGSQRNHQSPHSPDLPAMIPSPNRRYLQAPSRRPLPKTERDLYATTTFCICYH